MQLKNTIYTLDAQVGLNVRIQHDTLDESAMKILQENQNILSNIQSFE